MLGKHSLPHEHNVGVKHLLGSGVQPSTWKLKYGGILQLGDVVCLAQKISKLSVDEWNGLDDNIREAHIAEALKHYSNEIEGDA